MNKIILNKLQIPTKSINNVQNTQHIFGRLVENVRHLEKISEKSAQGMEVDPHELSFAVLDASRSVEATTSLVRVALQSYQDIMKMPA